MMVAGLLVGMVLAPAGAGVGDNAVVGQLNTSAGKVTTFQGRGRNGVLRARNTRNNRPALDVQVKNNTAPLWVNSSGLVDMLNVDLLDGYDASYLAPRATFAGPAVQGQICGTADCGGTVLQATIEAPGPGLLLIAGALDLERYATSDDNVTCGVRVDGVYPPGGALQLNLSATGDDADADDQEENCTITAWDIVDAGSHTVDLRVYSVRDTDTRIGGPHGGNLWAMWVPIDGGTGDFFE
jgi:hypothetical protein